MKIAEIMSAGVEFIDAGATIRDAAELMGELDVGALPVGTATALEGIITDRDVLFRVVAAGLAPGAALVRDFASRPVIRCKALDEVWTVMDLMAAHHVRRLPVEDDRGAIVGWITLADISRKLLVENRSLQTALSAITEDATAS